VAFSIQPLVGWRRINLKFHFLTRLGYISTSYSQEQHRGRYIGAISSSFGIGSIVGSGIVVPVFLAVNGIW
jgi:hypothetical protein